MDLDASRPPRAHHLPGLNLDSTEESLKTPARIEKKMMEQESILERALRVLAESQRAGTSSPVTLQSARREISPIPPVSEGAALATLSPCTSAHDPEDTPPEDTPGDEATTPEKPEPARDEASPVERLPQRDVVESPQALPTTTGGDPNVTSPADYMKTMRRYITGVGLYVVSTFYVRDTTQECSLSLSLDTLSPDPMSGRTRCTDPMIFASPPCGG